MKKIFTARKTLLAFDQLPLTLKEALRNSARDFSAAWILELLEKGYTEEQILMSLEIQQPRQEY